jgi:medium-chain acyl-[acyl-carrier-protein] hydrolase
MINAALTSNAWITCTHPQPTASLRLFCFSHAGGGAISFRGWADPLHPDVEQCAIELPGRGSRLQESPFTRLEPLVQALETALLPSLDKPFAFLGHSMGALLSFELTRRLRQNRYPTPVKLWLSSHRAPQLRDRNSPIHALPDSALLRELRRYNGTPVAVLDHTELMQLLLPAIRADFAVLETYCYTAAAPLACPIAAVGGLQDHTVCAQDLAAWQAQTSGIFSLQLFAGDHFFLYSSDPLLQFLRQDLNILLN